MSAADLPMTVSVFPKGKVEGPAYGTHDHTTWGEFSLRFQRRRQGEKDGGCFAGATFKPEPLNLDNIQGEGGERVRRLKENVTARTLIALDIETSKKTGEVPPSLLDALDLVKAQGWACAGYTSHNHNPETDVRYRLILPMSSAVAADLPCPEVVADRLGLLGVLDTSKVGASSLFYFPSAKPGELGAHEAVVVDGAPLDAGRLIWAADKLRAARIAEAEARRAAAHAEAAARREERLAAGFDPDDSLIEKLRAHYDLAGVLLAHGYHQFGTKYRHPNSSSGIHGADIATFGGIERVFSHNATDPLHADNLPDWCGVTALDVVDVVIILDFAGDRTRALRELATKHGFNKAAERKELARLLFWLLRRRAPQDAIETAAASEGSRLGLSDAEIISVATWVFEQRSSSRRAA